MFYLSKKVLKKKLVICFVLLWSLIITGVILLLFCLFNFSFIGFNKNIFSLTDISFFSLGLLLFLYSSAILSVERIFLPQNIIAGICNTLLIVVFLCYDFNKNYHQIIYLFFLSAFLQGFFLFVYTLMRTRTPFNLKFDSKLNFKPVFLFSIKALLTNVLFGILTRMDFWLLKYFQISEKNVKKYEKWSKTRQKW